MTSPPRSQPVSETELLPCPFCGGTSDENNACQMAKVVTRSFKSAIGKTAYKVSCGCGAEGPSDLVWVKANVAWNTRPADALECSGVQNEDDAGNRAELARQALRLLGAEDARQSKLHAILETIREQIRTGIAPEHRPDGLFKNIQDAVYAMRGRTPLLDDAALVGALDALSPSLSSADHEPGCQSGDFGPCDCALSATPGGDDAKR